MTQTCRVCGCTDDDCSQCIEVQGYPCHWVEEDLCSRCCKRNYDLAEADVDIGVEIIRFIT